MSTITKSLSLPALALALSGTVLADVTWTNGIGDRDWGNLDNWETEVPILDGFGEPVLDDFGDPTYELVGQLPTSEDKTNVVTSPGPILTGIGDTAQLDVGSTLDIMTGGDLVATNWFIIGYGDTQTGVVTVDGGSVWASNSHLTMGFNGTGTLNVQNSGMVRVSNNNLILGFNAGSNGTVNLDGGSIAIENGKDMEIGRVGTGTMTVTNGTLTVADDMFLGKQGTGTLNCEGGTVTINDRSYIGDDGSGIGELNVSGGSLITNDHIYAGQRGQATVTLSAGTIDTTGNLYVGNEGTGNGAMTMSGDSVLNIRELRIGQSGTGEMTVNIGAAGSVTATGVLMIGDKAGADGKLFLENGDLVFGSLGFVGNSGTGLIDMTGGSITIPNDKPLVIGRNTDASGEVLLKGGTISAGNIEFNHPSQGPSLLSHLEITDGTLILDGNRVDRLIGFIATGEITTSYGPGYLLDVVYDPGTNKTTLSAGPADDGFETWASTFPTMTGMFDGDDDNDGTLNCDEWYFYGTDPTVAQAHGPKDPNKIGQKAPGSVTFTHRRPIDRTGIIENYEWTTTLDGGWTVDGESNGTHTVTFSFGTPVPDGAGYELIEVTATAAPNDLPGFFARLNLGAN